MADKIAQAMVTLAEDSRDMKMSLRLLLKYEIQSLLERLSALGDDSLLILTNSTEGTCSHLGTRYADNFLNHLQSNGPLNLKDAFQKFCSNSAGLGGQMEASRSEQHAAMGCGPLQNQSGNQTVPQLPLLNFQSQLNALNSMITSPQHQVTPQLPTRFSPYMNVPTGRQQNFSSNISMERAQKGNSTLPPSVMERKKRNACRHFINKGHCWQGNTCAFLHTRDPQILDTFGINLTSSEDANQSPSSSIVETSAPSGKDPV